MQAFLPFFSHFTQESFSSVRSMSHNAYCASLKQERIKSKMKESKQKRGFTIIEVVLVLAIAGLIFLMVFLALPALQRNQRNTARRQDVGVVSAAVQTFMSNNRGRTPQDNETCEWDDTVGRWMNDAGNDGAFCRYLSREVSGNITRVEVRDRAAAGGTNIPTDTNVIWVFKTQSECSLTGNGRVNRVNPANKAAITISLEQGSNQNIPYCVDV